MKSWYKENNICDAYISRGEKNNGDFADVLDNITVNFCDDSELNDFFQSLNLLKGVPFFYIVPDEAMLPPEALRVFCLDQNWVDCLIDGAMSIGRNCTIDKQHDAAIYPSMTESSFCGSALQRDTCFGLDCSNNAPEAVRTGFLLRSHIVSGWPGMEVKCYNNSRELTILKLEIIGGEILFCIADGIIDAIEFTEPAESLHFGIMEKGGRLYKQLVSLKAGELSKSLKDELNIPFRSGVSGVIDIAKLAKGVQDNPNVCAKNAAFSSLEFAVEMLNKQSVVTIKLLGGWTK